MTSPGAAALDLAPPCGHSAALGGSASRGGEGAGCSFSMADLPGTIHGKPGKIHGKPSVNGDFHAKIIWKWRFSWENPFGNGGFDGNIL